MYIPKPAKDQFIITVTVGENMYCLEGDDIHFRIFESAHGPCTPENQRGQLDAHTILQSLSANLSNSYREV